MENDPPLKGRLTMAGVGARVVGWIALVILVSGCSGTTPPRTSARLPTTSPVRPTDVARSVTVTPSMNASPALTEIAPLPGKPATTQVSNAAPKPAVGAMTIYAVTNPNRVPIDVLQVISDGKGFSFTFSQRIPPGATNQFHLRNMPQVPSPFKGAVKLSANLPFTARIVGYDYPIALTSKSSTSTRSIR